MSGREEAMSLATKLKRGLGTVLVMLAISFLCVSCADRAASAAEFARQIGEVFVMILGVGAFILLVRWCFE